MAENVENVALKARKTKLNNKSKDDLIAIILRKDDVEKKLTSKLDDAKEKVTKLTDALAESNKKMNDEILNNASLKAKNTNLKTENQNLKEDFNSAKTEIATIKERNELLSSSISKKNVIITILAGIAIIAVVFAII